MNDQTVGQGENVVAHRISRRALLRATVAGFLGTGIGGGLLASSGFAPWARAAGSPVSRVLGGADLGYLVSFGVSGLVFGGLQRWRIWAQPTGRRTHGRGRDRVRRLTA